MVPVLFFHKNCITQCHSIFFGTPGIPRNPRKPPPSRIQAPGWNADPLPIEVWDHRFLAFVEEARDPRSLGFSLFFPDIWMVTLWKSQSWPGGFDLPMKNGGVESPFSNFGMFWDAFGSSFRIIFWANYNNSLTWIKAIWGWFPLLTMISNELVVSSL